MKRHLMITFLILLSFGVYGQQNTENFKSLSWLIGNWEGQSGKATLSENWKKINDFTMVGKGRTVVNGETVVVENLQLHLIGNHLGYIASPNDAPPVFFTLIESQENKWVFENLEHDFPQRIIYTRKSTDIFEAKIEGVNSKGENASQAFEFKRSD